MAVLDGTEYDWQNWLPRDPNGNTGVARMKTHWQMGGPRERQPVQIYLQMKPTRARYNKLVNVSLIT